jgi:hypothetical protein
MTLKLPEYAIHELIKTLADTNVFYMKAPKDAPSKYIIMQNITGDRDRHINGPSGMAQDYFQIDAYAEKYYDAKALAAEIEETLDGYKGTVYYGDNSPQDFVRIGGISFQSAEDAYDQTDEPFLYRVIAEYLVTYER